MTESALNWGRDGGEKILSSKYMVLQDQEQYSEIRDQDFAEWVSRPRFKFRELQVSLYLYLKPKYFNLCLYLNGCTNEYMAIYWHIQHIRGFHVVCGI